MIMSKRIDWLSYAEPLALRVPEAAEWLGISRGKMYHLVAIGVIPSFSIGKRGRRVPVAALKKWITQNTGRPLNRPAATRLLGR
jgi:excisionase family DNA binding protein